MSEHREQRLPSQWRLTKTSQLLAILAVYHIQMRRIAKIS
jgi:hypothetical protein